MSWLDVHLLIVLWMNVAFTPTSYPKLFVFFVWRPLGRISVHGSIRFEIEILFFVSIITLTIACGVALKLVQEDILLLNIASKVSSSFNCLLNFGALFLLGAWLEILFTCF